jgi:hypothetical protein
MGGHLGRPEHSNIRLGRRTEIVKRVQHAIAASGHQGPPVKIHAANAFGRPVGVAAEQRIIVRGTEEADDTELLDKLVPELLGPSFV